VLVVLDVPDVPVAIVAIEHARPPTISRIIQIILIQFLNMANIIDYLEWRGDLSFKANPLNEIDGAILARLTYQRFEMLSHPVEGAMLSNTIKEILALHNIEEKTLIKNDYDFMKAIAKSERFKNLTILDYTNMIEKESQTQFSAITLLVEESEDCDKSEDKNEAQDKNATQDKSDGKNEDKSAVYDNKTLLVFFRGTDNTLVGWKEDFNMGFMTFLPGQVKAADYLTKMSKLSNGKIIVGGHSKGGNLAVFASAFTTKDVQKRIEKVFNYDGPGFDETVIKKEGYERICSCIETFVPQSSVVGMLLEHEEKYIIVHSSRTGLWQHDIYSWDLLGAKFCILEEVDNSSRFIDYTLKEWIKSMSKEERESFVDAIFSVMANGNYATLREMKENWVSSGMGMIKGVMNLTPESRKSVGEALSLLVKSSKLGLLNFKDVIV